MRVTVWSPEKRSFSGGDKAAGPQGCSRTPEVRTLQAWLLPRCGPRRRPRTHPVARQLPQGPAREWAGGQGRAPPRLLVELRKSWKRSHSRLQTEVGTGGDRRLQVSRSHRALRSGFDLSRLHGSWAFPDAPRRPGQSALPRGCVRETQTRSFCDRLPLTARYPLTTSWSRGPSACGGHAGRVSTPPPPTRTHACPCR